MDGSSIKMRAAFCLAPLLSVGAAPALVLMVRAVRGTGVPELMEGC